MRKLWLASLWALTACVAAPYVPKGPPPDRPAVPGVAHEVGTFPGKDGVELFVQSWRPEGPVRGVLVVAHGLKDHGGRYAELGEALAKDGFAVTALDHRGHGRSHGDREWVEAWQDYVVDFSAAVERAKARDPGVPVFVLGHSMGGAIATSYVLQAHPKPAGLLLSAPALAAGPDVGAGTSAAISLFGTVTPSLGVLNLPPEKFSRDPATLAADEKDPFITQGRGPARTANELLDAIERNETRFWDLDLPILVLHGSADEVTDPDGSRKLVKQASSTDKTLKLYDGLFHDLLHEPEKAQVIEDVRAWLVAHLPVAAPAAP